jgi:NitT/TauT family transport system substrate-binding protein
VEELAGRRLGRRRLLSAGGLLAGAALGVACGQRAGQSTPAAPKPETLRFISWSAPRAEQANLFVARELGYFRDQGIEFEYRAGQGTGDAMKQLLAGNGDVAFVGPEVMYFTVDQGGDAVGIYNTYPQNIFVVMSWPDAGIRAPADLKSKTIGVLSQASTSRYTVLTLLATAGLKEADVTLVATGPSPAPLLERKVDAWSTITTTADAVQRQSGQSFAFLAARDYLNLPTDIFATTRQLYAERPDLLVRFLRAVRQGTEYMIAHPTESAQIVVKDALDIKTVPAAETVIRAFGEASQSDTTRAQGLGYFDLSVLREGARVYQETGLVKSRVDADHYFTNDLVAQL